MNLFHRKKEDEKDEGMVLNDYHEAFSWHVFWDEKVIGTWKKFYKLLKDHGILFFFLSPFQYKKRLIAKIALIFFGVLLGIVPRSIHMINQIKARNAASELAQSQEQSAGNITVRAMKSSQYKRQHLLVFEIDGATKDGVPSVTSGFNVTLSKNRGVDDPQNVSYKYKVLPVSDAMRLLVVYVDNRKQTDNTGIYNLAVSVKHQDKMETPIEVVLSDTQRTNKLFGKHGIDLTCLSEGLVSDANGGDGKKSNEIKKATDKLKDALNVYKLNEQRLKQMGMKIYPTYDDVKHMVKKYSMLTYIDDSSSVDAVVHKELPETVNIPTIVSTIEYKGKKYNTNNLNSDSHANDDTSDDSDQDQGPEEIDPAKVDAAKAAKKAAKAKASKKQARALIRPRVPIRQGRTIRRVIRRQARSQAPTADDVKHAGNRKANDELASAPCVNELTQSASYLDAIMSCVSNLNGLRQAQFVALSNIEIILTQRITPAKMGERYWVHK